MRLCSLRSDNCILAGVMRGRQIVAITKLNQQLRTDFAPTLEALIAHGQIGALHQTIVAHADMVFDSLPGDDVSFCAPYTQPEKICGLELNDRSHVTDRSASFPGDPPSFIKPASTIVGPDEPIVLPPQSKRVTGAAALGMIIGKRCKNVSPEAVPGVLVGLTTELDMTADDLLQRHPHWLTRAKSFDTFLSFGPWLVTLDELGDLAPLRITTLLNGAPQHTTMVANMALHPYELVALHSRVMTLKPGDVMICGTPGAVGIRPGDRIGCDITPIGYLENPVVA